MKRLQDKIAVVTGGNGVLGGAIAKGFAAEGAKVGIMGRTEATVNQKVEEIKAAGGDAFALVADVLDREQLEACKESVLQNYGQVDILVNAAGGNVKGAVITPEQSIFDLNIEDFDKVNHLNFKGTLLPTLVFAKEMVEQKKGGSIIQTASIYGLLGPDSRIYEGSSYMGQEINTPAVYSASKAAVIGLTKYLATYWADKNIRVNCLTPGGVESGQNDVFKDKYSNRVPLGRMGRPDEMVGALLYLASDASSYVTGQNIIVDGGWSAW